MSRYIVIKREDAEKHLRPQQHNELDTLLEYVESGRAKAGKPKVNSYLVLNVDAHYAGEVYRIMHSNGHTPCADCYRLTKQPDCNKCPYQALHEGLKKVGPWAFGP
jgi:hypothetical protein